jgi:Cys-rich protein (TIGR01571 family)
MTTNICGGASLIAIRGKLRGHYKIKGDIWQDLCILSCFPLCAAIQMKKQMM